jgi:V/A-type H+-transporting ATPase subunit I
MFRTTAMKLVELMILHQDIDRVLESLGKHANFQIQNQEDYSSDLQHNQCRETLEKLQFCRKYLALSDPDEYSPITSIPSDADFDEASRLVSAVDKLHKREVETAEHRKRILDAYDEARAFANLKVAYSELDQLTFLTFRIGRIDPSFFEELKFSVGERAVIVSLGEDNSRILAAASKKGRFALDTELKKFGFSALEIPAGFKGVPDEVLEGLKKQADEAEASVKGFAAERADYAAAHRHEILRCLQTFSLGAQVTQVRQHLESTQSVYRIMGWIASAETPTLMNDLDELTEGRIAIRVYAPNEVPSIKTGKEKVPVQYNHGAFVKSFERMVFSYGAPLYGTIDPTPVVAVFFTLLFGIMFGDVGQGFVFFLLGLFLVGGRIGKLKKWQHFGPILVMIGCTSMIMGLLEGDFFANTEILIPFGRWATGLFGEPKDRILELMPSREAMGKLAVFFGFTLVIGFIINSIGLVINITNQFLLGRPSKAIFSKTGICGTAFFWYVVYAGCRIAFTGGKIHWYDILCVVIPLTGIFFAEPLSRLMDGHRPILENGIFAAFIEGIVEILEVVSTNISNSISFLRVGAFALSHAVLSFIVFTLSDLVGGSFSAGGFAVGLIGNIVIILLEGLIVTIQVVRLQYYEFFSKFFTETGKEFKPFRFKYKEN